jgi:hypothetical protein
LRDRRLERSPLFCTQQRRIFRDELQQFVHRDDVPEGRIDGVELRRFAVIGEPVGQHAFRNGSGPFDENVARIRQPARRDAKATPQ